MIVEEFNEWDMVDPPVLLSPATSQKWKAEGKVVVDVFAGWTWKARWRGTDR